MSILCVETATVSEAWLEAVRALDRRGSDPRALHMVVAMNDPVTEVPSIRSAVDMLLRDNNMPPVETVANTIFPAAMALNSSSHDQLVDRYRECFPRLRKFKGNQLGTYFGRFISYPGPNGPVDQLSTIIDRLQMRGRAAFTRYEALVDEPARQQIAESDGECGLTQDGTADPSVPGGFAPIYVPGKDNSPGNFPCMSHCSFQMDANGEVHALAYYRSQSMVQRAYGNYLGLGRLLRYVAEQADLGTGQLTVVAGQAQIEMARRQTRLIATQPDTLPGLAS